jgi:DNA-binding transcriptional MerR regulator
VAKQIDSRPFRSGELARLSGVSSDSLRHYERMGVLARPARTKAGYRLYPPEALGRVRVIQHALAIGFSLKELAGIFRVREKGGIPCREVRSLAAGKLIELEQRIIEMTALRDSLTSILAQWDTQLAGTPKGRLAYLLEGLGETPMATASSQRRRKNEK